MADENDANKADDQQSEVTPEQPTPQDDAVEEAADTGDEATEESIGEDEEADSRA